MFYFPGYHPPGYRQQHADAPPHPSARRLEQGRIAGGQWMSIDGGMIYKDLYNVIYEADWIDDYHGFGAWRYAERLPNEAIEL